MGVSLWDWALEAYRRPGVEAACLRLQDEAGQCVPYLLWAVWADPTPEALRAGAAIARPWQDQVVAPLRAARRAAKPAFDGVNDAGRETLRAAVKAAELEAERLLLEALDAIAQSASPAPADPLDRLTRAVLAWGGPKVELSFLKEAARPFSGL